MTSARPQKVGSFGKPTSRLTSIVTLQIDEDSVLEASVSCQTINQTTTGPSNCHFVVSTCNSYMLYNQGLSATHFTKPSPNLVPTPFKFRGSNLPSYHQLSALRPYFPTRAAKM